MRNQELTACIITRKKRVLRQTHQVSKEQLTTLKMEQRRHDLVRQKHGRRGASEASCRLRSLGIAVIVLY